MPLVLSRENILLAYRNIKSNIGSHTAGTDKLTIADIGKLTSEEVTAKVNYIVSGTKRGYRPRAIRRKEIPKLNGDTRPLGIPCIWDRLIFKQVLESGTLQQAQLRLQTELLELNPDAANVDAGH